MLKQRFTKIQNDFSIKTGFNKKWFSYRYGFVNIDSENMYLTNSGNWSDTLRLSEKGPKGIPGLQVSRVRVYFWASMLLIAFLCLKILSAERISTLYMLLLLVLLVLPYFLYQYLRGGMGPRFYIPIRKIKAIDSRHGDVMITFLNKDNQQDTLYLPKVDAKGMQFLASFKERLLG